MQRFRRRKSPHWGITALYRRGQVWPIAELAIAVGIFGYIRARMAKRKEAWMDCNGSNENNRDPQVEQNETAEQLEERLREEVRHYERDLRELAET